MKRLADRIPRKYLSIIGVVWAALIFAMTWELLGWHLAKFKIPGAAYYSAILVGAPVVCCLCIGYVFSRKRFSLPRYEIPSLVGFVVAICLTGYPLDSGDPKM